MLRHIAHILIGILLLLVTLAWDHDGVNVTGFRIYQWRNGVMQTSPVAVVNSGTSRQVSFTVSDADRFLVDWTATAFNATAESEHSNHAGIRPDLPTIKGIE